MLEHTSMKTGGHPTTGYSQIWYSSPPYIQGLCPDGIPVRDNKKGEHQHELMFLAVIRTHIKGLQFGFEKEYGGNFRHHPFIIGKYHTNAYLLNPSVVITHEMDLEPSERMKEKLHIPEYAKNFKNIVANQQKTFPKYAITIISNTIDDMRKTAVGLKLPTENLEKLVKTAQKTKYSGVYAD